MTDPMVQLIREYRLIPPGSAVLCAVSGGADSIYLLHRLWRLRRELNFTLAAAHFDHRLRGAESAQDMEFVREFVSLCCGRERTLRPDGTVETLPPVELFTGSGDVAARAKETGRGLEDDRPGTAATPFSGKPPGTPAPSTSPWHTPPATTPRDPSVPPGPGDRSCGGCAAWPPKNGDLIRPLLTTTRGEIEDYLRFWGLPWREDPSNREDVYARNRLRHRVLPELEALYPGFLVRLTRHPPSGCGRTRTASPPRRRRPWDGSRRRRMGPLSLPAEDVARLPQPLAVRGRPGPAGPGQRRGTTGAPAAHLEALTDLCRTQDPSAQNRPCPGELRPPGGSTAAWSSPGWPLPPPPSLP